MALTIVPLDVACTPIVPAVVTLITPTVTPATAPLVTFVKPRAVPITPVPPFWAQVILALDGLQNIAATIRSPTANDAVVTVMVVPDVAATGVGFWNTLIAGRIRNTN